METRNETHIGTLGWAAIGAFVVAWDVKCEESLTHAFRRGYNNPRIRPLLLGAVAITLAHLIDAIPHQIDPFYLLLHREPKQLPDSAT
jgi:hypothetical protein